MLLAQQQINGNIGKKLNDSQIEAETGTIDI